ncbi:ABC-type transport auxiliary lipoprotein family protein [Marinobacter sp. LN3S78]|uniref:ABC-type transport auxiliary lipoprotein family protein n=1 Tax=Marinobacter sp. LN3S78 TaxID=3382300 RepID=UPI00387A8853
MSLCVSWLYRTAVLGLMVVLAGCSVALFPEKHPLRIFTLPYDYRPPAVSDVGQEALPALKVVRPQANGVLSGERIVIEPRPDELAAYSTVRWMTDVPLLLRDHVVRALRDDPRIATVVSDTSGSGSDITLTSELKAFQEDRIDASDKAVRLYLQAQLVKNGSRRTLATRDFHIRVPVDGDDIEAAISAFGQASDHLSRELADWVVAALADY